MALSDLQDRVDALVQDDSRRLTTTERDLFITDALYEFSEDYPQEKSDDTTGDGGYDYSMPSDWVDDFSTIWSIFYDITDQNPTYLEAKEYTILRSGTGSTLTLQFLSTSFSSSTTFRMIYTIPWTATTLPTHFWGLVSKLAASYCCEALAGKYAHTEEPTINADIVNYHSKSDMFAKRAKELRKDYEDRRPLRYPVIHGELDVDLAYPYGALTHSRWQR